MWFLGYGCAVTVDESTEVFLGGMFELVLPYLDERSTRLVVGAAAKALGHGGIRMVARAAGVSEPLVARGVGEVGVDPDPVMAGRVRAPGGGRKKATQSDPQLLPLLEALADEDSRGDPQSALRWTLKSTRNLAEELTLAGHPVSAMTVSNLLRAAGWSLQGNAKVAEGSQHVDRDAQFRYIGEQVKAHQGSGDPVISVDTKKKENVGNFKNAGREWRPAGSPRQVNTYDFPDKDLGKAIPYGVYDVGANTGWVAVGRDRDTAQFAVQSIRSWWHAVGVLAYPHAKRLLICADGGGSNGHRVRLWKRELAALAGQLGIEITVVHYPPGTSKWNRIEHRLFSAISCNWRGQPLTSHEVVVNLIGATRTRTGLTVQAHLDEGVYPTGIEVKDKEIKELEKRGILARHDVRGQWNYTMKPAATASM